MISIHSFINEFIKIADINSYVNSKDLDSWQNSVPVATAVGSTIGAGFGYIANSQGMNIKNFRKYTPARTKAFVLGGAALGGLGYGTAMNWRRKKIKEGM